VTIDDSMKGPALSGAAQVKRELAAAPTGR
jgi:hypothetical protein